MDSARHSLTSALSLGALAASATALGGPLDVSAGQVFPWTGNPGASFRRLAVGDLTGDMRADVVVLDGEQVHVLYGPGDFRSIGSTQLVAKDFAVVSGHAPAGRDSLVFSDASGLWHARFTFAEIDGDGDAFDKEFLHAGQWPNARRLLAMERPDRIDLVGIAGNGTDVILLADVFGSRTPMPKISLSSQIFDLAALNWDGGPGLELVTLSADGMRVLRLDGSVVAFVPGTLSSGLIVPFEQDGYAHDRAAAVVGLPQGNELFVVADASTLVGGTLLELPIDLGPAGVCGLAAGDVDADGDDDVLLNWGYVDVLPLGRNHSDGAPPDGSATFTYDPLDALDLGHGTVGMEDQAGWPVFLDADLDGDLDLLVALEVQQEVALARNTSQDHAAMQPNIEVGSALYEHDECLGAGTLSIQLLAPALHLPAATHVELVVWKRPSMDEPAGVLAVHAAAGRLSDAYALTTHVPISGEATLWTAAVYLVQLREVKRGAGGALLDAGPTFCCAFSLDPDTTAALSAQGNGTTLEVEVLEVGQPGCLGVQFLEREVDSGITPLPDPGDFAAVPPNPTPGGGV